MEEFKKAPPKFKLGDLVIINNLGLLFVEQEEVRHFEYGLISSEPYHYIKSRTQDILFFGWWTYDVLIDGKLIKMMPETFLKEVQKDENKDNKEK